MKITNPIRQQVLKELKEQQDKEYEAHLEEMINKYTDNDFKEKVIGG